MLKTAAIILAGGKSDRFGSPKPFLRFDQNHSFVSKLIDVYSQFDCGEIVLVLNKNFADEFAKAEKLEPNGKLKVVYNNRQELGRFFSLKLGLRSLCRTNFCFIQNIDNPFTNAELLKKLYEAKESNAYAAPEHKGEGGHPILVSPEIVKALSGETDYSINLREYLKPFKKIPVESDDGLLLVNINTKEDYEKYFE